MKLEYADIEIVNGGDIALAGKNIIKPGDVKRLHINALIDKSIYMLAINEYIKKHLKLPVIEKRKAQLADDQVVECNIVGPVEIIGKNGRAVCNAIILPNSLFLSKFSPGDAPACRIPPLVLERLNGDTVKLKTHEFIF